MITLLTMSLASPALAQTREVRVDPLYVQYLEQLETMDKLLPPDEGGLAQLWDGQLGFVDGDGFPLGTVFVGGLMPTKQEVWFMPLAVDPTADFGVVHEGWYPPGTEDLVLAGIQPGWDLDPCYDMRVKYKQLPDPSLTADLDYEPGIERTHFMLLQDGAIVGRLLREHHQVPNTAEIFVDHWALFADYAFPAKAGEDVWVVTTPTQYATTSAFFDSLNLEDADHWKGFAQVQYQQKLGYQCLGGLSF